MKCGMSLTTRVIGTLLLSSLFVGLAQAAQTLESEQIGIVPLSDEDMREQRGRGAHEIINIDEINMQLNEINETAKLDHNVNYSSNTGDNSVRHNAYANNTGFATVIQNSGNNVIKQNTTNKKQTKQKKHTRKPKQTKHSLVHWSSWPSYSCLACPAAAEPKRCWCRCRPAICAFPSSVSKKAVF